MRIDQIGCVDIYKLLQWCRDPYDAEGDLYTKYLREPFLIKFKFHLKRFESWAKFKYEIKGQVYEQEFIIEKRMLDKKRRYRFRCPCGKYVRFLFLAHKEKLLCRRCQVYWTAMQFDLGAEDKRYLKDPDKLREFIRSAYLPRSKRRALRLFYYYKARWEKVLSLRNTDGIARHISQAYRAIVGLDY